MLFESGVPPHQKGNLYGLRILHFELQLFAKERVMKSAAAPALHLY